VWIEVKAETDESGSVAFNVQAVKLEPRRRVLFSVHDGYGKLVFSAELMTNKKGVLQERVVVPKTFIEPAILWASDIQAGTTMVDAPKEGLLMKFIRDEDMPSGAEIQVAYL
jgi:hypothetical protein